jgi:hypothetical protein
MLAADTVDNPALLSGLPDGTHSHHGYEPMNGRLLRDQLRLVRESGQGNTISGIRHASAGSGSNWSFRAQLGIHWLPLGPTVWSDRLIAN